jgi:hypothetical protein
MTRPAPADLGIGPTGRATPITGIEISELQAGRVRRRWGEWDISAHRDAPSVPALSLP